MPIPDYTAGGVKLYKYTTIDAVRNILSQTKLRWRSPVDFNDPFDISRNLGLSARADELQVEIAKEIASLIASGSCPENIKDSRFSYILKMMSLQPESVRAEFADKILKTIIVPTSEGQIVSLKALEHEWQKTVHQMRVLCLSERNDVLPMWAHYADKGRGVVLEFTGSIELDSNFLIARKVSYTQDPPSILCLKDWVRCFLGSAEKKFEDLYREVQYVKKPAWEYEKEWRVVTVVSLSDGEPYSDISFFPQDLRGIYLGYNCADKDKKEVLGLLNSQFLHVRTYSAELAPYAQSVSFSEIK